MGISYTSTASRTDVSGVGTDKSLLHSDARRLFASGAGDIESEWDTTYDTKYKSRQAALRHEARDGTAFASIALPSHYSAIRAVLDHVKQRLGRAWNVEHVVDWGVGTGSALWYVPYSTHASLRCLRGVKSVQGIFALLSEGITNHRGCQCRRRVPSCEYHCVGLSRN